MSFTDGTYDGRYHLRQRQGELPRRAHPLRHHEDRQDHRDPQRLRHPRPASAEISRAPATCSPTASTSSRFPTTARRPATIPRTTGRSSPRSTATRWRSPGRCWSTATSTTPTADYQGKYAFSTCYNPNKGTTLEEMTDHEQAWAVVFNIKRIEQAVKDGDYKAIERRQGRRRPTRIEIHPLHSDPELAARRQHRARRHPRRHQRQAFADRQRDRRAQARRSVRRQDQGARRGRRRAGARPRPAAHRLRRARQRLHDRCSSTARW